MPDKLILKGTGASAGTAVGVVRIVHTSEKVMQFSDGDVLVTEMTDPTMVIMMGKASAIVTDTGGLTSHAAIVSREMGIPCVVATKVATKILRDRQKILVDGDKGEVYLVT